MDNGSNGAALATAFAKLFATWFLPVVQSILLVLAIVLWQFRTNGRGHHALVCLAVFIGCARIVVVHHAVLCKSPWEPSGTTWTICALYFAVLGILLVLAARRVRLLWAENAICVRVLHVSTLFFMMFHGINTVIRPYLLILNGQ
ncbi:MAG: hypothetical protein ACI8W8_002148 [Rhodothermales bacterium]|jgi:hypothetical protein